jgi:hypothetical protein
VKKLTGGFDNGLGEPSLASFLSKKIAGQHFWTFSTVSTQNRPPPVLDFHEPNPTTFRRLPDASSTSVVRQPSRGSHYWNSGYVQTGGQFKQLGERAKEIRVL